jgi:hypothetical protein
MKIQSAPASWCHRGCHVDLDADSPHRHLFRVTHSSGVPLGEAANLEEARQLIDRELPLLRQRLAATA